MPDRYDSLNYANVTASVGSMPRRWKAALHVPPPKSIEDYFAVETDNGTVAEHLGATIAHIRTIRDAVRTTSYNVPEPLEPEVATAVANAGSGPWPANASEGLATLVEEMEALAAQLDELSPHDWNKSADAGRATFSILDLVRGASRVGADRLAVVERIVASLVD